MRGSFDGPQTNFRPTHSIQGNNTYLHARERIPARGGGHHEGGGGGEAEEEESCDLHACVLVNCCGVGCVGWCVRGVRA